MSALKNISLYCLWQINRWQLQRHILIAGCLFILVFLAHQYFGLKQQIMQQQIQLENAQKSITPTNQHDTSHTRESQFLSYLAGGLNYDQFIKFSQNRITNTPKMTLGNVSLINKQLVSRVIVWRIELTFSGSENNVRATTYNLLAAVPNAALTHYTVNLGKDGLYTVNSTWELITPVADSQAYATNTLRGSSS